MLLALIASLVLFFLDTRLDYFSPTRSALSTIVYPIQVVASFPSDASEWMSEFFENRDELKEQNAVLEATNLLNNVRLQKLQNLERENTRLRELLGSSFRLTERVLVAELLSIDLDSFSQQVVLNKGLRDGVFSGQPVLDAHGVMGQVTEVTSFSSRAMLLTDPSHGLPVQINRNGLRAVAIGRGMGESLQLEHLAHNADVRVGDVLVTSGLGGRFPVGYPVGKVIAIHFPQGKAFAHIAVKPAAELDTSREVLLVLPTENKQEKNELKSPEEVS
ncbi:MAG: rod shape-determining protein MreC [Pseudomonadota bacterium]|nr:rod shape-determining protein MreC [Pseudomonadota bacterium]